MNVFESPSAHQIAKIEISPILKRSTFCSRRIIITNVDGETGSIELYTNDGPEALALIEVEYEL